MSQLEMIRAGIREYIMEHIDEEVEDNTDIFDEGLVNSLFTIDLVTFIEREFSVKITMDDLSMENLNTIDNIVTFVSSKMGEE